MTFRSVTSKGYTLRLDVNETSYSVADNTSKISWSLYLESKTYYFQTSGNKVSVNVDGNVYNNSNTSINMSSATTTLITSGSKTIKHNDNGSKTINVSASYNPSSSASYMPPSLSLSNSMKLTDIPRASSIACSSPYIGDTAVITLGNKVATYTNTVTYQIGTLTGTIATKTSETVLQLETNPLKDSIYALIPKDKSIEGTMTCTTYNGDTKVGQNTAKFNLYCKEDECKPTVTGTVVDTNTKTINLTGDNKKLIKYASKPKVTVNATANNKSTISSYSITVDGQAIKQKENTFDRIESSSIVIDATDSRGYSNPTTLNPQMINYIELHINNVNIDRTEDASNEVILNADGVWFNGDFNTSKHNTLSAKFQYKESSSTTWIDGKTITPTISGNTFKFNDLSLGNIYDYNKEYQFKLILTDLLMTVGSSDKDAHTVAKGQEILFVGEDEVYLYGDLYHNDKLVDFDTIKEIGSNDKGNWIKFNNGILIQYGTKEFKVTVASYWDLSAIGDLKCEFPIEFKTIKNCNLSMVGGCIGWIAGTYADHGGQLSLTETQTFYIVFPAKTFSGNTPTFKISFMAIGTWN